MPSSSVVVVGSFVQDLIFHCPSFPRPGQTAVGSFSTGPGGKGANQAVAARRAGASVAFVGAVGDDPFGRDARTFQEAEGIDCRLTAKSACSTGAAGILVDAHGQNQIVVALQANAALSVQDIDASSGLICAAQILVTQLEANLQAEAHALQMARAAGAVTILNPAPMRPDFDPALLKDVSVLIPNETEFIALAQSLAPLQARIGEEFDQSRLDQLPEQELHILCRLLGPPTVIITLGGRGCFLSSPVGFVSLPAFSAGQVLDTTGAGDAFVGSFAAALAEFGRDQEIQAARFASAAAALSVTRLGAARAMPLRTEIEALLALN